jgi:hypothetical protein
MCDERGLDPVLIRFEIFLCVLRAASASILVSRKNNQVVAAGNVKERTMSTAEQSVTSTFALGGNRARTEELLSRLRYRAQRAAVNDALRVRHAVAASRAEATRLEDHARWSQHNADACWYAGKLRAARQLDAQAARERELAAWLTAEADALVPA